jgi:hypothetical protein
MTSLLTRCFFLFRFSLTNIFENVFMLITTHLHKKNFSRFCIYPGQSCQVGSRRIQIISVGSLLGVVGILSVGFRSSDPTESAYNLIESVRLCRIPTKSGSKSDWKDSLTWVFYWFYFCCKCHTSKSKKICINTATADKPFFYFGTIPFRSNTKYSLYSSKSGICGIKELSTDGRRY